MPIIDCTTFKLTEIRPLTGEVLVELQKETESCGILLPEGALHHGTRSGPAKFWEAIVRRFGPADPRHPFEVTLGDRVIVSHYAAPERTIRENGRQFKILKMGEILGVFE